MATIAIGDIHGQLAALDDLLQQIRRVVSAEDTVVFLGDYIDRGSCSKQCVDAILRFRTETSAETVCLLGNHEDWMLQTRGSHARHSWLLGMDAYDTIRSYSEDAERTLRHAASQSRGALYSDDYPLPYEVFFDSMPAAHVEFFETLKLSWATADCVCSHAGLAPGVPVDGQSRYALLWGDAQFPARYRDEAIVVYGHRNNAVLDDRGWPHPASEERTIGVDTIAHGVLTAIRLPDRRVWQSAQYQKRGQSQSGLEAT